MMQVNNWGVFEEFNLSRYTLKKLQSQGFTSKDGSRWMNPDKPTVHMEYSAYFGTWCVWKQCPHCSMFKGVGTEGAASERCRLHDALRDYKKL